MLSVLQLMDYSEVFLNKWPMKVPVFLQQDSKLIDLNTQKCTLTFC